LWKKIVYMPGFKTEIDIYVTGKGLLSQLVVNQNHDYNVSQTRGENETIKQTSM